MPLPLRMTCLAGIATAEAADRARTSLHCGAQPDDCGFYSTCRSGHHRPVDRGGDAAYVSLMITCANCGAAGGPSAFCAYCGAPAAAAGPSAATTAGSIPTQETMTAPGGQPTAPPPSSVASAHDAGTVGEKQRRISPQWWAAYVGTGITMVLLIFVYPALNGGVIYIASDYYRMGMGLGSILVAVAFLIPLAIGWSRIRESRGRRTGAIALAAAFVLWPVVVHAVLLPPGASFLLVRWLVWTVQLAAPVAGWVVLRRRSGLAWIAVAVVFVVVGIAFSTAAYHLAMEWRLTPLIVIGGAWLAAGLDRARRRAAEQRALRDQQAVASPTPTPAPDPEQVRQWRAAYALANPGQPIPDAPGPPGTPSYAGTPAALGAPMPGTNIFAILALCFSPFSIVAIAFGHIALSQIKRTGESGRGLAIAGLVIGYALIALAIAYFIWIIILINSL